MKITKKLSFGLMILSILVGGLMIQNQIGSKEKVKDGINNLSNEMVNLVDVHYPKDLVVRVDSGQVWINQPLPYCVVVVREDNLGIVFDNSPNPNIKSFEEQPKEFGCKPVVLVGKDYVAMQGDKEIRVWNIPKDFSGQLTHNDLLRIEKEVMPKVQKWLWYLYLTLPLVLLIPTLILAMIFNFWYTWILGIVIKLAHLEFHPEAKNKYWIALFFGSVLAIINIVTLWGYNWSSDFPLSGTILITIASIAYLKWREGQENYELKITNYESEEEKKGVKGRRVVKKIRK